MQTFGSTTWWSKLGAALALGLVCTLLAISAAAQGSTAAIVGTVTDASGAAIPGATVVVRNLSTGVKRTVIANGIGFYRAGDLQVGTYSVSVTSKGFKQAQRSAITLEVAQVAEVDMKLQVGTTNQIVNVSAAAPLLQTQTSDVSTTISPMVVQNAPLDQRNFYQLATLTPGVVHGDANSPLAGAGANLFGANGNSAGATEGFRMQESGSSDIVINGNHPNQNNTMLDGVSNNEPVYGTAGLFPPPDSIKEFKIITATPPAEYGSAAGGVILVVTKGGTNKFHGSAYEYLRNDALDARQWANHGTMTNANGSTSVVPKFKLNRNEWGGTFGGPIIKNRTFFFVDYNGYRNIFPATTSAVTVPTINARQGNFSDYLNNSQYQGQFWNGSSWVSAPVVGICNPATSVAAPSSGAAVGATNACSPDAGDALAPNSSQYYFPNATIPTGMMDPAALAILNAFPAPNVGSASMIENNYLPVSRNRTETEFHMDARIDDQINQNNQLFGRLTWENMFRTTPSLFPKIPAGFGTGQEHARARAISIGETHIFSSSVVNDFHFGFLRTGFGIDEPGVNGCCGIPENYGEQLGIKNANPNPTAGGLPGLSLQDHLWSDGNWIGDGGGYEVPSDTYSLADNLTIVHGAHTIDAGVQTELIHANDSVGNTAKGEWVWCGQVGSWCSNPASSTGNSITDMLLGVNFMPNQGWGGLQRGITDIANQSWSESGFYVQDDWQATPRLTLNLGLRYDLYLNPKAQGDQYANFNIATGQMDLPSNGSAYGQSLVNTQKNNWGPHLGFAYSLTGSSVIRGGFTTMYAFDPPGFNGATPNLAFNPPNAGMDVWSPGQAGSPSSLNANGWGINDALSAGMPLFTSQSGSPTTPFGQVTWENPNKKTPVVNTWQFGVQHQLDNWLFAADYVGNRGYHLGALAPVAITPYTAQDPALTGIMGWEDWGVSSYNALEIRVDHRFSKGFSITDSYTWGHALDNTEGTVSGSDGFGSGNYPMFPNALGMEWGNSENDIRHILVQSYDWQLPLGHGQRWGGNWNGIGNDLIGGWQVFGINTFQTGPHLTPGSNNQSRAFMLGNPNQGGAQNDMQWFNTAELSNTAGPAVASRGMIVGPGQWDADLSLMKDIGLGWMREGAHAQFRASFYNVFNHVRLGYPDTNPGDGKPTYNASTLLWGGFGTISSAYPMRETELTLKIFF